MKGRVLALCMTLLASAPLVADGEAAVSSHEFALQAELLYFKAVTNQSAFIGKNAQPFPTISETRFINDPSYRVGFRLVGEWFLCDCVNQFQARYTHLTNTHSRIIRGTQLMSTFADAGGFLSNQGEATSRLATNYNAGDVVWDRYLVDCPDFNLHFLLGLHVATVGYKEHLRIASGDTTPPVLSKTRWDSHFWGIGPEAGFTAFYALPCFCNLAFVGDMRAALLAGRTRGVVSMTAQPGIPSEKAGNKPGYWGATPGIDAKLGFNYAWCGLSCTANLEIGYEMAWYSRVINKIAFSFVPGIALSLTSDFYSDYTMHGPYAAARVSF